MKENKLQQIKSLVRNTLRVLKIVWQFDKRYFFIRIFFEITSVAFPTAIAGLSAIFINKLVAQEFASLTDPTIIGVFALYITLPLIFEITELLDMLVSNKFTIFFDQYIYLFYIKKVDAVDLQTHEDSEFRNLFEKVKESYYKIMGTPDRLLFLFRHFLRMSVAIVIVSSQAWWIGCILVLAFIPDFLVEISFGERKWGIWDAQTQVKRKFWEIGSYFSHLEFIKEIRIFQTAKKFINTLDSILTGFNTENWTTEKKRSFWKIITSIIGYGVLIYITIYFLNSVITSVIAVGTFLFLIGRITDLRSSLGGMFRSYAELSSNNLYINDILKFFDTPHALINGTRILGESTPTIHFNNVSFAYPKTEKVILKNLSFTLKAGEKIAIVGVNGAGKTTLVKLMMRLYDPTEGSIALGDTPLTDIDLHRYYNEIGFLSQEYAKYRLPLLEAIALGNITHSIDREKVIESCKRAGADEFISTWKDGYDSHLGKEFDGVEPSVGQWQKLALARLFYKNPRIWILDEPTSSIDAVAEMQIFDELGKLPEDKTVILISHRFNTVKNADRIMVIENGSIVEFDSHANLMKKKSGQYKTLFETQKESYE